MSYVLGIDPSITATGICLLHDDKPVEYFTIGSKANKPLAARLDDLHADLITIISSNGHPRLVAIETPISPLALGVSGGAGFNNNIMAYGVFYQLLGYWQIPYVELSPHQLKMVATGKGNAKKDDVIRAYDKLGLGPETPKVSNHNEIDAYWLAYAGWEVMGYKSLNFHRYHGWWQLNDKTHSMLEGLEVIRP